MGDTPHWAERGARSVRSPRSLFPPSLGLPLVVPRLVAPPWPGPNPHALGIGLSQSTPAPQTHPRGPLSLGPWFLQSILPLCLPQTLRKLLEGKWGVVSSLHQPGLPDPNAVWSPHLLAFLSPRAQPEPRSCPPGPVRYLVAWAAGFLFDQLSSAIPVGPSDGSVCSAGIQGDRGLACR